VIVQRLSGVDTELLDGRASDVLFFDRISPAVDPGDERGVRDPEGGPQVCVILPVFETRRAALET
jgi:hypothetical protein